MKNIVKKVIFILIILMILVSINTKIHAWSGIIEDGKDFISAGQSSGRDTIKAEELQSLSGYLYNILLAGGVVIAVIVATVLGIQFMLGGAEGQAKVKEMLVPFVIGCIVVFGGFGFWKIAITVGNKLESAGGTPSSSSSSYERDENGNPICRNCGDELGPGEQRRGKCSSCGEPTGI